MDDAARLRLAESILGHPLDADQCGPCPGAAKHTTRAGRRDFQVRIAPPLPPTAFCLHKSCADEVAAFNRRWRAAIYAAERDERRAAAGVRPGRVYTLNKGVALEPRAERGPKYPPYDAAKLQAIAAAAPPSITGDWLAERSPVRIPRPADAGAIYELFFECGLYQPGEFVLIFTNEMSQGQFAWHVGTGGLRLGARPGVAPVRSEVPNAARCGMWFLCNPVSLEWAIVHGPEPKMGRRHGAVVTSWRYLILESDDAPVALWLRALVLLPLKLVALYTSGGKSVHALVRLDAASKAELDLCRDRLRATLCPLGADGAAMTAVRLSRLPGALRLGKQGRDGKYDAYAEPQPQRLLWLNPRADGQPIIDIAK